MTATDEQTGIPVIAHATGGGPLTMAEIDERLDEHGIYETDADRDAERREISPPADWKFAETTSCAYVTTIIAGFPTDGPKPGGGRNPWLCSQEVRLACAHRLECVTENDYRQARETLAARHTEILATTDPPRKPKRFEFRDAHRLGIKRASEKTVEEAGQELGGWAGHTHAPGNGPDAGGGQATPDSGGEGDGGNAEAPDPWESYIAQRMGKLRADREANRRLDDEQRPPVVYPPVRDLTAMLAQPDIPTRYRIEGLAPVDARVMVNSQFKAGKTTLVGNLMRSLVDVDPFLGRFAVNTPASALVLIDDEMSENTLRPWLREQNITNTDAVADVITLRGNVGAFNLLDTRCRDYWVTRLQDLGCDYLILDCLRPVLDALGLDEGHDVGTFLIAFDTMLHDAGIGDGCLLHHMGHTNERARGDSRLQDWPDATWRLVREEDTPNSPRYFTAFGRDVDVHEGRLAFDPATRRLTYTAGSRTDAKTEAAKDAVIELLAECVKTGGGALSKSAIEKELKDEHHTHPVRAGIRKAVDERLVVVEDGPRGAKLHRIARPCPMCGKPVAPQSERHQSCMDGAAE